MDLTIETQPEADGRWIAEVIELPGVLRYGKDEEAAIAAAQALSLRVLADKVENHELPSGCLDSVRFRRRESVAL